MCPSSRTRLPLRLPSPSGDGSIVLIVSPCSHPLSSTSVAFFSSRFAWTSKRHWYMSPPRMLAGATIFSVAASASALSVVGLCPKTSASPSASTAPTRASSPRRTQISWRRPTRSRCRLTTIVSGMSGTLRGSPGPALSLFVLEGGFLALRRVERHPSGADRVVELVLDRVDVGGPWIRLRPEVARVGRMAAELEADQVVLLEVARAAAEPVRAHLLELEVRGVVARRANRPGPAADADRRADRGLRDIGVEDARRQRPARADQRLRRASRAARQRNEQDEDERRGAEEQRE